MNDQGDIFNQDLVGLDDEEARVWKVIRERRGSGNAMKVADLAWRVRLPETKVREVVSHLVRDHGKLIGSSTTKPPGFYIIDDPEELRAHIKSLQHRGIMCLVRAAALAKTSVEDIFKQGRLELDG